MRYIKSLAASFAVALFLIGSVHADEPIFSTYEIKKNAGGDRTQPVRTLKLVRFSSQLADGPNVASGDVLVYDTNSADGFSVRLTAVSGDAAIAGIAATAIVTADSAQNVPSDMVGRRNWGWIVVHGPVAANCTSGTCGAVAGNPFMTSDDSGDIMTPSSVTLYDAGATNVTNKQRFGGVFLTTPASGKTIVFVEAE